MFNSTLHAGKVKTYIQFSLAIANQALTQRNARAAPTRTTNDRYTFRTWLLRLGMIGPEFETARFHLLSHLEGNIACAIRRSSFGNRKNRHSTPRRRNRFLHRGFHCNGGMFV